MITLDLLEHYLRATGWERGDRGWHRFDRSFADSSDVSTMVDRAALCLDVDVRYRLGLCAGAERLREAGLLLTERATVMQNIAMQHMLLRLASIDPEAWEKARRT